MLHLHRADRADRLALALAALLAEPLADPFASELVAVPTRGMERWLSQRLSGVLGSSPGRSDGICAGIDFPSPRRLLGDALAAASGVDPETDPWLPERSVWPLLEVVQAHAREPWLAPLARNVGLGGEDEDAELRRGRRLSVVRHLAELLHRYGRYRPELITAWAAGRDEDGAGDPLPDRLRWQAELWRALREAIGTPSPAERLAGAAERLVAEPGLVELPERLASFGLTRLAAADIVVVRALAHAREVHLFLLHPSPALWDALAVAAPARPVRRRHDTAAAQARHPLLRSWGRDSRELQLTLAGDRASAHDHSRGHPQGTLLERLQHGVIANAASPGAPLPGESEGRPELEPADRSVQIHAGHGRARQVELLRDAVLALLESDPTLEPRDVIVMCPDIESFAPLIQATFGAGEGGEATDLRVRLADRSLRQTNPVLAAIAALLELTSSRVTASEVLDFAGREPIRRRFRLRDDDLTQLQRWVRDTGIRWGLDAQGRAPFKLALSEGTWRTGLDRILLGVAMDEAGSRRYREVLPLDGVEDIDLAGRLAELLARLRRGIAELSVTQPVAAWAQAIGAAAAALTDTAPREAWQQAELRHLLDDLVAEAGGGGPELAPAEVRALLADRLAGRPTRANFRTGHLTVCTMYPMRSVPHRVVCLLGLDDGAFPRRPPGDGDDVLAADPLIGERDNRSEDRQLLLDALLAAEEHLLITFTGADERTNLARPPAVPVGELLDTIDATVRRPDGRPARESIIVRHPLQPFDPRNFTPGRLVPGRPWSFDRVAYAGASAMQRERRSPRPFLEAPLPDDRAEVIALTDLIAFVAHPVRAFLAQRLGVRLSEPRDELSDALPVELDNLERWGVGQRLLTALLAGVDAREAYRAEIARGLLPPGHLAKPVIDAQLPIAAAIARAAAELVGDAPPVPLEVHARLADGRLVSGSAGSARGDVLLQAVFSRVEARQRLDSWVRLLAATATHPGRPLGALTIGRARGAHLRVARIAPLGDTAAERAAHASGELERLVDLYDRGMREPLPLPCRTAAAYAQARRLGDDPLDAANDRWESNWRGQAWFDGEDVDREHLLTGGKRTLAGLMAELPALSEQGDGWAGEEPSRFGRLARRLWDGLLDREQVS